MLKYLDTPSLIPGSTGTDGRLLVEASSFGSASHVRLLPPVQQTHLHTKVTQYTEVTGYRQVTRRGNLKIPAAAQCGRSGNG